MIDRYEPIGCPGRNLFCQKDGDGRERGSGCQAAYIPASAPESASAEQWLVVGNSGIAVWMIDSQ
jgi:hypothetical protein